MIVTPVVLMGFAHICLLFIVFMQQWEIRRIKRVLRLLDPVLEDMLELLSALEEADQ